jgi:hypothetical protein
VTVGGVVQVSGDFNVMFNSATNLVLITVTGGTATIEGFGLTNVNLSLNSTYGVSFSGNLNFAPVFNATLAGAYYWSTPTDPCTLPGSSCTNGIMPGASSPWTAPQIANANGSYVTANAGDFNFSATNVTLNIGGFGATGSIVVGDVGGSQWVNLATSIGLSNSGDRVNIAGSFQSNGNFTFTGSGNLTLAGFHLTTSVTASKNGANVGVSGTAQINAGPLQGSVNGSFTSTGSGGVSATLNATLNLNLGGFNMGGATLTLAISPGNESLTVTCTVGQGDFSGYLSGSFAYNNNTGAAQFNFNVAVSVSVGSFSVGSANLQISNPGGGGSVQIQFSGVLNAFGYQYGINGLLNGDWSFSIGASGSSSGCSGQTDLGFALFQACYNGSYSVSLTSWAPYVTMNVNFNATVSVGWYYSNPNWSDRCWEWFGHRSCIRYISGWSSGYNWTSDTIGVSLNNGWVSGRDGSFSFNIHI